MTGLGTADRFRCVLCSHEIAGDQAPTARVPSNVRAYLDESFAIWRCPACNSLHATDSVDLDHYYRHYPYQNHKEDLLRELILQRQTRRLRGAGMTRTEAILDFGCGSGLLVHHLRRAGYQDVAGYDAYTPPFDDPSVLERQYDVVHAQDVIEHVEDPRASFAAMVALLKPGGLLCIGTPNADAVDLADVLPTIHTLHQPYHRHILSRRALEMLAAEHSLEPVAQYRAPMIRRGPSSTCAFSATTRNSTITPSTSALRNTTLRRGCSRRVRCILRCWAVCFRPSRRC